MRDGSCSKVYLHLLPGHVAGHARRRRPVAKSNKCLKVCHQTLYAPSYSPGAFIFFMTTETTSLSVGSCLSSLLLDSTMVMWVLRAEIQALGASFVLSRFLETVLQGRCLIVQTTCPSSRCTIPSLVYHSYLRSSMHWRPFSMKASEPPRCQVATQLQKVQSRWRVIVITEYCTVGDVVV